jgi:D-beta-D-heptose 7-phosphate kinase/D-beta-D-heptose 1-phosphate adenosyltransferase
MKSLFQKFKNTGILVIGDVIVDQYIFGKVKRISPEAPVPVVEVSGENLLMGGAANVANNIASLGGKVFISGVIGRDEMGSMLTQKMREKGINTDGLVIDSGRPTIVKTRVIAHNQQVVRFDREDKSGINRNIQSSLLKQVKDRLHDIKAVIISDYCKGIITKSLIKNILRIVGSRIFVAVDPKTGHFNYYKDVNLITPNLDEASAGSGIDIKDEETLIAAGRALLKKLRCNAVLITRGGKGMTLFERAGKVTHIPTFARDVYDVTGAGDTVIATFALYHSAGAKLNDAANFANHAAGVVVGKIGTAVATRQEVMENIKRRKP